MYHTAIVNPKTNKKNVVRVFSIETNEAVKILNKDGVKALSWELLNQPESVSDMEKELYGDHSTTNFALSVFENALDFQLGLTVFHYIKAVRAQYGKSPKIVRIAVNRKGDTFIISKNGEIIFQ